MEEAVFVEYRGEVVDLILGSLRCRVREIIVEKVGRRLDGSQ